jgi:transcriptional regulator with XRE-family HTH domain
MTDDDPRLKPLKKSGRLRVRESDAQRSDNRAITLHIASRVRARRDELGLSRAAVTEALGVANQQLSKYETGENRIGGSTLFQLARLYGVPVQFFFEDIDPDSNPEFSLGDIRRQQRILKAFAGLDDPEILDVMLNAVREITAIFLARRPPMTEE